MRVKTLTLVFLLVTNLLSVKSQPYCDVRLFNMRDGLAANTISGIEQTPDELVWFATWNGLCCYDGYHFSTFRDHPTDGEEVLSTNRIKSIRSNAYGNVWCCTFDNRVFLFNTKTCQYVNVNKMLRDKCGLDFHVRAVYSLANGFSWLVSHDADVNIRIDDSKILDGEGIEVYSSKNGKLKGDVVNKVLMDERRHEWVFSNHGVTLVGGKFNSNIEFEFMEQVAGKVYFASKDGKLGFFQQGFSAPKILRLPYDIKNISCLLSIHDRILYIGTNAGIIAYDVKNGFMKRISAQHPASPSPEVKKMFKDSKYRIWAFTGSDGIMLISPDQGTSQWLQSKTDAGAMTSSNLPFMYEDRNHTIWVVPKGGTYSYYDESTQHLEPFILKADGFDYANLPNIDIDYIDKQGNMWFNCTHDLILVNFKYRHFQQLPVEKNKEVRALLCDSKHNIWVGDSYGIVMKYDMSGRLIGYINAQGQLQQQPARFANKIYSIYEDRRNRMWIGTKGDGIFLISNGKLRHFLHNSDDRYSISNDDVYSITEDTKGRIYVGTHGGGLNIIREKTDGTIDFLSALNVLKGYPAGRCDKVRRILVADNGTVLISTTSGLLVSNDRFGNPGDMKFNIHVHQPNDTTSLFASDVMQSYITHDGKVLFTTLSGGIQYTTMKEITDKKICFHQLEGININDGIIHGVLEDNNNKLWILREASVEEYDPAICRTHQYGPNELGDKLEFSEAEPAFDTKTNRIILGAMGEALAFLPQKLRKSNYKPSLVFTSIQFQGEQEACPVLGTALLDIPSDKRNVTINFAALDYTNNYLIRYAYKIEGKDADWTYLQPGSHSASFSHIPNGKYRLLVKSTNADGVWMDNVKALNIYAHPTFFESVLGRLFLLLIVGGIGYASFYVYNLRKNASLEKQMGEMKTKFFTDLGHKLRTPLTLIGGPVTEVLSSEKLSDMAHEHLAMVQRNSRNMLALVNKMLNYDSSRNFFVDDENAPVFANQENSNLSVSSAVSDNNSVKLLIVEDNDDLRAFLVGILHREYDVLEAENGKVGLEKAEKEMPDFIITDVMMPVMDGLVMVHQIKQNKDICHIPIIVLSAKASLDDRLQGLKEGIDDYITKPFSATYLKQRVENIIAQRRMLQQNYLEHLQVETSSEDNRDKYKLEEPRIVDADDEMMKQLMIFLNENISDSSLRIEDMATAVNLGRTVFYEKIRSVVGMKPVDFLRHIRIQRSEELITKTKSPFSQIAYAVGFGDAKYFSTSFKKETGMTPSEYRQKSKE